jgi:hypothetical protein
MWNLNGVYYKGCNLITWINSVSFEHWCGSFDWVVDDLMVIRLISGTVWLRFFLGVKVILTIKLEVIALKPKVKLFSKSYFYFKKC